MTQATWNELMDIEAATLATMEATERKQAYDAGMAAARNMERFSAVPSGCPYPDSYIDGYCDALQQALDKIKETYDGR